METIVGLMLILWGIYFIGKQIYRFGRNPDGVIDDLANNTPSSIYEEWLRSSLHRKFYLPVLIFLFCVFVLAFVYFIFEAVRGLS